MTEAEWLAYTQDEDSLYNMLIHLRDKVSDRKLRLFAVACCQRPVYQTHSEHIQRAIRLAERMADEAVDEVEWREVHEAAKAAWQEAWTASLAAQGTPEVERLVWADMVTGMGWVILEDGWEAAYSASGVEWNKEHIDEPTHQIALLRDIFGNPFQPASLDRSWLSWSNGTVPKLAQVIYVERAFDRLPILADALEEAGCTDAAILAHCRSGGEHVRGCWVVDLILGKS
jgi:hypothetical protein